MPRLLLEADPELRFLLPRRHRAAGTAGAAGAAGSVELEVPATDTVGHVVRMVGIPPTEIGRPLLDGVPVDLEVRPTAAGRSRSRADRPHLLAVPVRPRPQRTCYEPPRFLLDVHLRSLARRLRLLGLDAAWEPDAEDAHLVERAGAKHRVLLTADRGLLHRGALAEGALVRGEGAAAQLADVLDRFAPPLAPWTRCVRCNGLLERVRADQVAENLRPGTRRSGHEIFSRCTRCAKVFWRGAHAAELEAIVRQAQDQVTQLRGGPAARTI